MALTMYLGKGVWERCFTDNRLTGYPGSWPIIAYVRQYKKRKFKIGELYLPIPLNYAVNKLHTTMELCLPVRKPPHNGNCHSLLADSTVY